MLGDIGFHTLHGFVTQLLRVLSQIVQSVTAHFLGAISVRTIVLYVLRSALSTLRAAVLSTLRTARLRFASHRIR